MVLSFNKTDTKTTLLSKIKSSINSNDFAKASIHFHQYFIDYGTDKTILDLHKTWVPKIYATFLDSSLINARSVKWKKEPNVKSCFEGTLDTTEYLGFEKSLNLVRLLAGVPKVNDIDMEYSVNCQKAAWCMAVNDKIEHKIPNSWKCHTTGAAIAASNANLSYGYNAGQAILGMMMDEESTNKEVGHRRWLLNPSLTFPGYGLTNKVTVVWVIGERVNFRKLYKDLDYYNTHPVMWPSAGYFPEIFATKRFSVSLADANFSNAQVEVQKNGKSIAITKYKPSGNYANNTLVFDLAELPKANDIITVAVSNIRSKEGKVINVNYQTIIL